VWVCGLRAFNDHYRAECVICQCCKQPVAALLLASSAEEWAPSSEAHCWVGVGVTTDSWVGVGVGVTVGKTVAVGVAVCVGPVVGVGVGVAVG
jgi:hypothetical protein